MAKKTEAKSSWAVELSKTDLVMVWNLTQTAKCENGPVADALVGLRDKLRPLVEEAMPQKK